MIGYFIPNFYSIDRIGNQWLYLSVITVFTFFYLLIFDDIFLKLKTVFAEKSMLFYCLFLIWAFVSISYSLNATEALVTFNQYFTVFLTYLFLKCLTENLTNAKSFILNTFLFLLFFEIVFSLIPILLDLEKGELVFRSMTYSGLAANINITAFSLLYKTPILLYFFTQKKKFQKIILAILFFSILFIISILGTRGAFIGLIICITSFFIYIFSLNKDIFFKVKHLLIISSIIAISIFINFNLVDKGNNVFSRASSISINTEDGSVNQRLRYYKQGMTHFINNPFTGVGIGNWKIKSIDYDKKNIAGYVVPYHAHNDLIQLLTELGILGFLFYSTFIFLSIKDLFIFSYFEHKINFLLIGSFLVYFLDSLINFPISRPISQLFLVLFICLIPKTIRKND